MEGEHKTKFNTQDYQNLQTCWNYKRYEVSDIKIEGGPRGELHQSLN